MYGKSCYRLYFVYPEKKIPCQTGSWYILILTAETRVNFLFCHNCFSSVSSWSIEQLFMIDAAVVQVDNRPNIDRIIVHN